MWSFRTDGVTGFVYPAQPCLAPIGMNRPWAESMVPAHAVELVDNNTVPKADHPAGVLLDDFFNSLENPAAAPAILQHLAVEDETSILVVRAQRGHDLVLAPHFDQVPRSQPQRFGFRARAGAPEEWVRETIGNTQLAWELTAQCLELVEQENEKAADHEQRAEVAGSAVRAVLPNLVGRQWAGSPQELSSGTAIQRRAVSVDAGD